MQDCPDEFKALMKKGNAVKLDYGPGNVNNKIVHIRGYIDGRLLTCTWDKRWNDYRYTVDEFQFFLLAWHSGCLKPAGKSRVSFLPLRRP